MTTTIWKFTAKPEASVDALIEIPVGAQFLTASFDSDCDEVTAWAIVNTDAPTETRKLQVRGTGWPRDIVGGVGSHIATHAEGIYVWHIFDGGVAR